MNAYTVRRLYVLSLLTSLSSLFLLLSVKTCDTKWQSDSLSIIICVCILKAKEILT